MSRFIAGVEKTHDRGFRAYVIDTKAGHRVATSERFSRQYEAAACAEKMLEEAEMSAAESRAGTQ